MKPHAGAILAPLSWIFEGFNGPGTWLSETGTREHVTSMSQDSSDGGSLPIAMVVNEFFQQLHGAELSQSLVAQGITFCDGLRFDRSAARRGPKHSCREEAVGPLGFCGLAVLPARWSSIQLPGKTAPQSLGSSPEARGSPDHPHAGEIVCLTMVCLALLMG